jgi:hypothetical protein
MDRDLDLSPDGRVAPAPRFPAPCWPLPRPASTYRPGGSAPALGTVFGRTIG